MRHGFQRPNPVALGLGCRRVQQVTFHLPRVYRCGGGGTVLNPEFGFSSIETRLLHVPTPTPAPAAAFVLRRLIVCLARWRASYAMQSHGNERTMGPSESDEASPISFPRSSTHSVQYIN
jgi:hypothetical protein